LKKSRAGHSFTLSGKISFLAPVDLGPDRI